MKILVIGGAGSARDELAAALRSNAELIFAEREGEALALFRDDPADAVLLSADAAEPGDPGLLDELLRLRPRLGVVIVTAPRERALEALEKFIAADAARAGAEALRDRSEEKPLRVRCYGPFEVWRGGEECRLPGKALEVFAYLVSRKGVPAETADICRALYRNVGDIETNKSNVRHYLAELRAAFRRLGAEEVLVFRRNAYSVDPARLDCDWYKAPERAAREPFMTQYAWADAIK